MDKRTDQRTHVNYRIRTDQRTHVNYRITAFFRFGNSIRLISTFTISVILDNFSQVRAEEKIKISLFIATRRNNAELSIHLTNRGEKIQKKISNSNSIKQIVSLRKFHTIL